MEDEEIKLQNKKNIYIYKALYLIRTNLPSSEFFYIIMILFKYIGLIIFSLSLNDFINDQNNNNIEQRNLMDDKTNQDEDIMSTLNLQSFLSNLMINGKNLNILNKNYQIICLFGFCLLIFYILLIIYGFIYMKIKYHNNYIISSTERKIKNISKSSNFEKKLFQIISYIFLFIAFFHQYIIEYYLSGLIVHMFSIFKVFNNDSFQDTVIKSYYKIINEYLNNDTINEMTIIIINLIVIILTITFLYFFLAINSTKTLFTNIGFPFYHNEKYLIIKIIIYNYNPIYGIIKMFNINIKIIIILISINVFIILIDIILTYFSCCFYPNKVSYVCIFVQFFCLFSVISEIFIYITQPQINSIKSVISKLIIELINSLVLTALFIRKKNEYSSNIFANNLFSDIFTNFNPCDIYYYIETYINYSQNKRSNYMILYRIIQTHILSCNKNDCICKVLIPRSISYSLFTNFSKSKDDNSKNDNINHNNNLINSGEIKNNEEKISNSPRQSFNESPKNLKKNINQNNIKKLNIKNINDNDNDNEEQKTPLQPKSKANKNMYKRDSNIMNNSDFQINDNIKPTKDEDLIDIHENRKLKDEQFQMIGEQEIINRINFLYKQKKDDILETYIFIHIQYLIKIKQNYRLALYYVGKYSYSGIKFSFLSRYYLYEIKKYISKTIINLLNINVIKDPYIIKYRKENLYMKKLISYINFYLIIKKLLKISCEKIIYFYFFRSELHNSLTLRKYVKTKIYPLINSSQEIQNAIYKIEYLLGKYFKTEKHPLESIELSYLICNFFKIIYGKIPQNILKNITPILNFKKMHYPKSENDFQNFQMSNPLIISLTKKDTFNICYFTSFLLNKLGYKYLELKNKDFHEKLFPGSHELIKEHAIIMKHFLFFYKNAFTKNNTFIKSKEGYLVPINFICCTFPNFTDDFNLIVNIIFNENGNSFFNNQNSLENNAKNSNINSTNDTILNNYFFLLNYDFDFYGITKNFYLEFDLNQKMLRELKLNFLQFFCIDEYILSDKIQKEKNKILKKFPNTNYKISLIEANRAYTIFQNIKMEKTFKLREEKLLEHYFSPSIHIYDKIDKKKILLKIPELMSIIDELGLDYEWYLRFEKLKERLIYKNINLHNNINFGINIEPNENNKKKVNITPTPFEQIQPEKKLTNIKDEFFEVIYSIKKLGSKKYYVIILKEKIYTNFDKTQKEYKLNEIYHKIEMTKENVLQRNIQKNKILNRIISASSPDKNKENSIKSKSFSKAFIPQENISKKNTLSVDITNTDKHLLSNSIAEDKKKPLLNLKDKNEEPNKENIAKNEKKEDIIDKSYNKKTKMKKKETVDDEENSPLVNKNLFNEQLQRKNKKNSTLIIILYIIIIMILIINVIIFGISSKGFEASKNVLQILIYLEIIKVNIFIQGFLSITYCINGTEDIIDKDNIHGLVKAKIESTLYNLKLLQEQINIIINNKYCNEIMKLFQKENQFFNLNDDWNYTISNLTLMEELRSLSYKIDSLTNSTDTCNVSSSFYLYQNINSELYKSGKLSAANEVQKIFYYFIRNLLTQYKIIFDELSEEIADAIEKIWYNYQYILMILLIFMSLLITIFLILYIIKICFDFSYYQLLFIYYYNIENEQLKFENYIYYLYKTVNEFNLDNINFFEYVKRNDYVINSNEDVNKAFSNAYKNDINNININNMNNMNNMNNNENSITNLKKKYSKKNSLYSNNNLEKDESKYIEKNNVNRNMLNGSMNGSSSSFLNQSNKIPLNYNIEKNDSNDKNEKIVSKEESINSLLKISKKILPNSLKISLILIIIGIIIYLFSCILNIIILYNQDNTIKYSTNLSMNILERIPRLMGLVIYSCISVIVGNANLMKGSPKNYNQSNYLTYFEINSMYYSEDLINKYFQDNYFGELLIDILRINYNFDNYFFQGKNNVFPNTKKWEELLRINGYYCINGAIGEATTSQENYNVYDFAFYINLYSSLCKIYNSEIDDSGIQVEITYIIQIITNKYIEFINYKDSNLTIDEVRINFFGSKDVKRIIINLSLSMVLYFDIITYSIYKDFGGQNNSIINKEIIFSFLLFVISFAIIVGLIISVDKNESHKKLFTYFSQIPNINYNN